MLRYRVAATRSAFRAYFDIARLSLLRRPNRVEVVGGRRGPLVVFGDVMTAEHYVLNVKWGLPIGGGARPLCMGRDDPAMAECGWLVEHPEMRCILPASEFWLALDGGSRAEGFRLADTELFAFAGIWNFGEKGEAGGFAVLTCEPSAELAARGATAMPVILDRADHERWTSGYLEDPWSLLRPYAAGAIRGVGERR